ncbi:MAG: glycoside hydrolase family 5 protein [Alphaproteobacteria bacterium]|nr:glycoside hydrolase family 5 protein [Alphaproteobacteria bacterium]MBV9372355.1 glycoside hydrolase family 5 protein [Alphaproteobacteria bacterium]MBV9899647.1 glycoside hydrolase family 5 protein [Alphaproteobacteria bacterium]
MLAGCATQAPPARPAWAVPTLARGLNVLGYDPIWTTPGKGRFQARHFRAIRAGGFDFVRVNLQAFAHMDGSGRLDPRWLARLDWVVREASAAGLTVILDEHDFNACSDDPAMCRTKLGAFWRQVAPRYRNAPPTVLFELLNEPHGKLDAAAWNALAAEMLAIVRQSNPTRTVVIGPTQWNSLSQLPSLSLPETDRHLLVTFHYYEPFRFTHQGASWTDLQALRGVGWGSEADRARLETDFAEVAAWSRRTGRPVLLGEFGAYEGGGTPMALRAAYTEAVARAAERRGFAWAYWQFDSDFIAWDMKRDSWVEPIRQALAPR